MKDHEIHKEQKTALPVVLMAESLHMEHSGSLTAVGFWSCFHSRQIKGFRLELKEVYS